MANAEVAVKYEIRDKDGVISVFPPLDVPEVGGLGSAMFRKMKEHQDEVAQIDGLTGEKDTWDQLLQRCVRTAIGMRSRGITQEDIVTICSFNYLNTCVPLIASLFLGAKVANLDPTISSADTVHLLKQVRPKMVFVGPEAIKLIENAIRDAEIDAKIVVLDSSGNHMQFSEFLQPSADEKDFVPVEVKNVKDTAVIYFSSGTTGLPKGICLNHYALLVPRIINPPHASDTIRLLVFSSFYWLSGMMALLSSIFDRVIRVVYPKFDADQVWGLIENHKVNLMFLAPSQIIAMCKNGKPENGDLSSLQMIAVAGGPISKEQMVEIRQVFDRALVGNFYACTELTGNALRWGVDADDIPFMLQRPDAVGRPLQGLEYKVVDPETEQALGPNQRGELRIKSIFDMNGYYKLDSSDAWDSDGFLKTGDVVYYDEDYCFYIVDRVKEMLKFQSWHVVPAKLEAVLLSHPAVAAAVVFGLPHPEDGDHPMGLVVLKKSSANGATGQELEKYVEERVDARQKLRGGVKIVNSIPVTPTGKYNRRHIRDLVLRKEI